MTRLRLAAIALTLLISSNAWADLKTFDVDPQYQQEVFAALKNVLNPEGVVMKANGRVELLPSGQILVNADAETLAQVEQVLQALRTRAVAAGPRAELRYWAVLGSRAPVPNPPGTATPSQLSDVLAELKRLYGDLSFRVIGMTSLTTQSGQRGEVNGGAVGVRQTAFVQGETLNATIEMNLRAMTRIPDGSLITGNIEVRTSLRRGEFIVLGESEFVDGRVFYIVHWPEE